MVSMSRWLVEPLFRLVFGRPLDDQRTPDDSDPRACGGLVIAIGGVGGLDLCGIALRYALGAERPDYAFHHFRWGQGFGRWFADLSNVANRERKAELLAETVRRFHARLPGVPIFLVAKSGGAGVLTRALESLEPGTVERAIMLAPALSPGYDLTAALRAVNRELVVFFSPLDLVVLGAGTRLFGTADRVRTASAGLCGFLEPRILKIADPQQTSASPYAKLRQVRWTTKMVATGHLGGHIGPDSPVFLKRYVVPLLRTGPAEPC
jgi:hypothetical protein